MSFHAITIQERAEEGRCYPRQQKSEHLPARLSANISVIGQRHAKELPGSRPDRTCIAHALHALDSEFFGNDDRALFADQKGS